MLPAIPPLPILHVEFASHGMTDIAKLNYRHQTSTQDDLLVFQRDALPMPARSVPLVGSRCTVDDPPNNIS
jgi:hypothetical protein